MNKIFSELLETPARCFPYSEARKRLRAAGRVRGGIWEPLETERTVMVSRYFRKDAFLVEMESGYFVLAPADSLEESHCAALLDDSGKCHLAICEQDRKTGRWSFRSADSGMKMKLSPVLILGEVLAWEEKSEKGREEC